MTDTLICLLFVFQSGNNFFFFNLKSKDRDRHRPREIWHSLAHFLNAVCLPSRQQGTQLLGPNPLSWGARDLSQQQRQDGARCEWYLNRCDECSKCTLGLGSIYQLLIHFPCSFFSVFSLLLSSAAFSVLVTRLFTSKRLHCPLQFSFLCLNSLSVRA